jgi:hypothetical protein
MLTPTIHVQYFAPPLPLCPLWTSVTPEVRMSLSQSGSPLFCFIWGVPTLTMMLSLHILWMSMKDTVVVGSKVLNMDGGGQHCLRCHTQHCWCGVRVLELNKVWYTDLNTVKSFFYSTLTIKKVVFKSSESLTCQTKLKNVKDDAGWCWTMLKCWTISEKSDDVNEVGMSDKVKSVRQQWAKSKCQTKSGVLVLGSRDFDKCRTLDRTFVQSFARLQSILQHLLKLSITPSYIYTSFTGTSEKVINAVLRKVQ